MSQFSVSFMATHSTTRGFMIEVLGSSCLSTVQLACINVVTCGLSLAVNVPPAVLIRLLREHRSEWVDFNIDAYSASALKASSFAYPGMRPMRFTGNPIIMPLSYTIELEEMLEVIRLEGHSLAQEDAFMSRDIHLLQETVLKLPKVPSLKSLGVLCSEDAEQDFFNNIIHLQACMFGGSCIYFWKYGMEVLLRVSNEMLPSDVPETGQAEVKDCVLEVSKVVTNGMTSSTVLHPCSSSAEVSEIQSCLRKSLLPKIQKLLTSDADKFNVNISLVALKLLKLLPADGCFGCLLEGSRVGILAVHCQSLKGDFEWEAGLLFGRDCLCGGEDILRDVSEEKEMEVIASKIKETRKLKSFETIRLVCPRLLTVLLRNTRLTLSSDQLHMVIQFPLFIDLERDPLFVALTLLKATVNCKVVVHEIYDLVSWVAELMFPKAIVDEHSHAIIVHLVVCLANDNDNRVRSMTGAAIMLLIACVSADSLHSILEFSLSWYLRWKTAFLLCSSAQVK
ncbi:homeobox-leucine zipper family protein [Actinidia rufa]|uniref:Homeobox-leucine zipper family protein n=1 Tax=Actinidia rufa TaxID=165716 RepID=A0A7J0F1F3_9ERIC|nr:homeobox-leucine zipper family protein [Actinidia rufa]